MATAPSDSAVRPALLPAPSASNRLQAYEDAIAYRMLLSGLCEHCGENGRCDVHEPDVRLIENYRRHYEAYAATLKAEREASLERWRKEQETT